jgi:hypothetical protein
VVGGDTVRTNSIIWKWFKFEYAKFPGTTNFKAVSVINAVYQQTEYKAVTRFCSYTTLSKGMDNWVTQCAHEKQKPYEIPQQIKTSFDVKPQNGEIYANSEARQFTIERGIYTEPAIRIVADYLRLQRTVWSGFWKSQSVSSY